MANWYGDMLQIISKKGCIANYIKLKKVWFWTCQFLNLFGQFLPLSHLPANLHLLNAFYSFFLFGWHNRSLLKTQFNECLRSSQNSLAPPFLPVWLQRFPRWRQAKCRPTNLHQLLMIWTRALFFLSTGKDRMTFRFPGNHLNSSHPALIP